MRLPDDQRTWRRCRRALRGAGGVCNLRARGTRHPSAVLDNGSLRAPGRRQRALLGNGDTGRLGYCNLNTIGDDETPPPWGRSASAYRAARAPGT